MFFLALALLLSVAPITLSQQTSGTNKATWSWIWPDASLRQTYPNIHAMAVDNYGNIFVSMIVGDTTDGMYVSRDDGKTFSKVNSLIGRANLNYIWSICLADSGDIFAGMEEYLFKSTDAGETWIPALYVSNESFNAILRTSGDTLFAGGYDGIYRSADNGGTWTNVDSNNVDTSYAYRKFNYITCFTVAANGYIYAGTGSGLDTYSYGIRVSKDRGSTWTYANNGITKSIPDTTDSNAYITSLAAMGDTVFAASAHLYRSTDNGQSWQAVGDPLFYNNESGAIISTTKGLIVPTWNSFYITTDGGNTWQDLIDFQLPINVWSAVQINDSTILMGMWNGLGKLVIHGPLTPVVEHPSVASGFSLSQNYPNPFNPTTTIRFSIPKRSFVTLSVYNILGQLVKTLVNEEKSPGSYEASFDGTSLPSGTYFYRLNAGNDVQTKKMILLK
jgi:photosystem II stability/assembly factor-like uncharacterized protein